MSKHTPGPWNIYFNSQDDFVIRKMFADGQESHVVVRCHSGAANARLIAAAPDLFGVAEMVLATAGMPAELIEAARAAIAKAGGES